MRIAPLVLVVLAAGLLAGPSPAGTSSARRVSLEQEIVSELNRVRAQHGLAALRLAPGLADAADTHSRAMLAYGFFTHESRDGTPFHVRVRSFYPASGFASWSVGENLLFDSRLVGARAVVRAWLNSPPHRRTMLTPTWREVGLSARFAPRAPSVFGGGSALVVTMDLGTRTRR
jgi:uncharacterized protein YkwD